jgi:hypothetical protein
VPVLVEDEPVLDDVLLNEEETLLEEEEEELTPDELPV